MLFRKKRLEALIADVKALTKDYIFAETKQKCRYLIECPLGYEDDVQNLIKKHKIKIISRYYFYNHAGFLIK